MLREQNAALQILATLAAQLEILTAQQQALIAQLHERIAQLERQLGLNSGNSGKPPSSDGLKKKPVRVSSLRERSGKKPGGQKGHPGETLRRSEAPDDTIDHFPEACAGCGKALSEAMATDHIARQVFDLPPPQPLFVTKHRAHSCVCAACGTQTRAHFPDHVKAPVQYGARIAGIVVYLLHFQMLPEKRLTTLMGDLFGVQLTTATIAAMSQNCAARFTSFATALYARIAAAAVKHLDETGFRIGGKTQWLHIAATVWLTFYRISPKRGDMPENLTGIAVHDHWKPYYTLEGIKHALCNAHHLRELKALVEIEKHDWARKMQRLLRRGCHATNNYGPYQFPEKLIPLIILNAMEGKPLPVYGAGANVRDWLHVDDHARALHLIASHGRPGEKYNVGGRNERRNIDVVRRIADVMDALRPDGAPHARLIAFVADRPGHDHRYAIDAGKLEAELGWRATETFDTGIAKTVRWYLENESWWRPLRDNVYAGERLGTLQPAV